MKLQLESETGEPLRQVEIPKMSPWPAVVRLGAETFGYHMAQATHVAYRRCFAMNLDGYLPGMGMRDARVERA